jgi:CPA2 family monovalent cation:H+ antiporter-2
VLAILRGDRGLITPTAAETLHAGDILAIAGTRDAIAAAIQLVAPPAAPSPAPARLRAPRAATGLTRAQRLRTAR